MSSAQYESMSFIANPNAGPTLKIAEGGVLFDGPLATTAMVLSRSVLGKPLTSGMVFLIDCDVNGTYVIRYIDPNGVIRQLQASANYTASGGMAKVVFSHFVREAYIEFTPASAANNLHIEGWSFGRGS